MFSESMLSMPSNAEDPEPTSYWPAAIAMACAWSLALLRGILGLVRHEGLDLDLILTGLIVATIPLIVLYIRRREETRRPTPDAALGRRPRPRLVLISNH